MTEAAPLAPITLAKCADQYLREHIMRNGKLWRKPSLVFTRFFKSIPKTQLVEATTADQVEQYVDGRLSDGVCLATVQSDLTFVKAMIRHAHKRNRIRIIPYIPALNVTLKERRPLTEGEFLMVMAQEMSDRLRRYYWVAYFTGHRSAAIEQLDWKRVDFEAMTIDFNVPGKPTPKTKRRNPAFPIPAELLVMLKEWKEKATDGYVIGLGPRGRVTTTYHEAAHVVRVKAGLTDPSLVPRHCMRKMFVTELADRMIEANGAVDMETIGALVMDNPDMLRKHYHRHKENRLRGAVDLRAPRSA